MSHILVENSKAVLTVFETSGYLSIESKLFMVACRKNGILEIFNKKTGQGMKCELNLPFEEIVSQFLDKNKSGFIPTSYKKFTTSAEKYFKLNSFS